MRQRAIENDVHGIIEVRALRVPFERLALGAIGGESGEFGHIEVYCDKRWGILAKALR